MLLWAGVALIVLGFLCFAADRRTAWFFYAHVGAGLRRFVSRITDLAKGAHWLAIDLAALLISWVALTFDPGSGIFRALLMYALAFFLSLGAGSAVLHGLKLLLCRRRPRDQFELGLYGFLPLRFEWQYDSFPSGHALTIVTVAVIVSCAFPQLALLWFAIAALLSLTRAIITSHYLSDVFVGAGMGLIASREVIVWIFPLLARPWF